MRTTDATLNLIQRAEFADGAELAANLATMVAGRLADAIAARGKAMLAVSGGSTPKRFFAELSRKDIAWDKVTVTLVDERMVPSDHERSNHRLADLNLLQNHAAAARFVPLFSADMDAASAAVAACERIDALGGDFDVVVLGMGTDGHTASFFPGGSTLEAVLDPECSQSVMAIEAPGAGEPRLTLSLRKILAAGLVVLHIEGDAKKTVLEDAMGPGPVADMPVRAVLRGMRKPLEIFWAP